MAHVRPWFGFAMFWSRSTSERRISWRQLIDAGGLLLRKILKLHLNYLCNYLYYTISIYLHKNRCIKFPQIIFFQTKHSRTSTSLVNISWPQFFGKVLYPHVLKASIIFSPNSTQCSAKSPNLSETNKTFLSITNRLLSQMPSIFVIT